MLTRSPLRRTAAAAVVAVIALAGCSTGNDTKNSAGEQAGYVEAKDKLIKRVAAGDRDAAPELAGKSLEDRDLSLADFKGKVVVLNVWASWCNPCRGEAPALQKLSAELGPQGVQFLGINSKDASKDNARNFERKFGITYPSLTDASGSMMLKFRGPLAPTGLPATYVVDRQGRIAAYLKGPVDEELLRSMITPVLGEG